MEQCIIMSIPAVALRWSSGKDVITCHFGSLPTQSDFLSETVCWSGWIYFWMCVNCPVDL